MSRPQTAAPKPRSGNGEPASQELAAVLSDLSIPAREDVFVADEVDADEVVTTQQGGYGGGGMGVGQYNGGQMDLDKSERVPSSEAEEVAMKDISTHSASLDIDIPLEGRYFLFTTPQGSLDLSMRPISVELKERSLLLGLAALVMCLLYGVYRLCLGIGRRMIFNRRTHRAVAALVTVMAVLVAVIGLGIVFLAGLVFAALLWVSFFKRFPRRVAKLDATSV